jgi:hypothetical protein
MTYRVGWPSVTRPIQTKYLKNSAVGSNAIWLRVLARGQHDDDMGVRKLSEVV